MHVGSRPHFCRRSRENCVRGSEGMIKRGRRFICESLLGIDKLVGEYGNCKERCYTVSLEVFIYKL